MLKIRWSRDHLIFNMGTAIPWKDGLYIEMGPGPLHWPGICRNNINLSYLCYYVISMTHSLTCFIAQAGLPQGVLLCQLCNRVSQIDVWLTAVIIMRNNIVKPDDSVPDGRKLSYATMVPVFMAHIFTICFQISSEYWVYIIFII